MHVMLECFKAGWVQTVQVARVRDMSKYAEWA